MSGTGVQFVNPQAEVLKKFQALAMNINAALSLQEIMKTNLGPKGTLKMLVGGGGQIKLTKDGNVLLNEMHIQHPTASMIARCSTAQDDIVGDGTTSNVLFIGELLRQAQKLIFEGVHPRIITKGYELAKKFSLDFLEKFKISEKMDNKLILKNIAQTSLSTKLQPEMANILVDIVVDALQIITVEGKPIDLFMIEIMHMTNKLSSDTRLIRGLVLDHGGRHSKMPTHLEKAYILTCNISLEYEKTEVNSNFFFDTVDKREKLYQSERKLVDEKTQKNY